MDELTQIEGVTESILIGNAYGLLTIKILTDHNLFKYLGSNVKRKLLHYALVSEKQETSKVIDIAWDNNYDEVDGRRRRKHLYQVGLRPLLVPWSR